MRAVEDRPEIQVFDEIAQVEHLLRTSVEERLPEGVSYAQFEVLNLLIRRGDGSTPAEVAGALNMTRSGFTNTLQQLERRGLVTVAGDAADKRRKRLRLTGEGRGLYLEVMMSLRPRIDALRGGFTSEEFRAALPFLRALSAWMRENR